MYEYYIFCLLTLQCMLSTLFFLSSFVWILIQRTLYIYKIKYEIELFLYISVRFSAINPKMMSEIFIG